MYPHFTLTAVTTHMQAWKPSNTHLFSWSISENPTHPSGLTRLNCDIFKVISFCFVLHIFTPLDSKFSVQVLYVCSWKRDGESQFIKLTIKIFPNLLGWRCAVQCWSVCWVHTRPWVWRKEGHKNHCRTQRWSVQNVSFEVSAFIWI
jgi:hypothetical protein